MSVMLYYRVMSFTGLYKALRRFVVVVVLMV